MSEDRALYIKMPKLTDEQLAEIEKLKREGGVISVVSNYAAPLPCKQDENGEIREQRIKALLAKISAEMDELKEAIFFFAEVGIKTKAVKAKDELREADRETIAEEAADTITSITTMLEALGIDEDMRTQAQMRVNEKNRERGRLDE